MNIKSKLESSWILTNTETKETTGNPVTLSNYEAHEKNYAYAINGKPLRYKPTPSPVKAG